MEIQNNGLKKLEKNSKNLCVSQPVLFLIESQFIENDFGHGTILFLLVIWSVNRHGENSFLNALYIEYTISKVLLVMKILLNTKQKNQCKPPTTTKVLYLVLLHKRNLGMSQSVFFCFQAHNIKENFGCHFLVFGVSKGVGTQNVVPRS